MHIGVKPNSDGVRPSSGAATWHCEGHWRNRKCLLVEDCCDRGRPHSESRPFNQALSSIATAVAALWLASSLHTRAALLAYEPFTNSVGTALISSGDGFGFNGAWQSNGSSGVATNLGYGLSYTDSASNTLATTSGSGFFQGLTTANSSMQPIRLFNFSRGTNGTDSATTWISFLVFRTGPTGTLAGNPFGRGANVPHDIMLARCKN